MKSVPRKDKEILRELAREQTEAAADPINAERQSIHRAVDRMEQGRPSITIFQLPWGELRASGELDLHCSDDFCRHVEGGMRSMLYKWRNFPGDDVVSTASPQPYCIHNSGFGLTTKEDTLRSGPNSAVASHRFHVQIKDEKDISKIKTPIVTHDAVATEENFQKRCEIFDGLLQVNKVGCEGFWFAPWDELVRWTGVQEVLMDMALRPAYVHKLIGRLVDCWQGMLDQYEEQNLLELPARQTTISGAAQVFSEVSPAMHAEFALQYEAKVIRRFRRVHYGCCEPLHDKVDLCAEHLPNMYQISMSPWVDFEKAVRNVGNRFIFGWRPNPAYLAHDHWDPDLVRRDIRQKLTLAKAHDCVVAIYLKDISTVRGDPRRLTDWDRIAKECIAECY